MRVYSEGDTHSSGSTNLQSPVAPMFWKYIICHTKIKSMPFRGSYNRVQVQDVPYSQTL